MQYYGTRLSENISKREPEGYLLCLNVPVARTGVQEYWPEEIGRPPGGGMIPVHRPEEEVFSEETIASFQGLPVTNDHPPDGVDIENIRRFQAGHAQNVRRGSGEEADLLMADLIITDKRLIEAILRGKREISCGYTYELHEENGEYIQRKIRGNHIAVVDAGRAGSRVSIKDSKNKRSEKGMKKLTKVLARMAKDGDVETVAEIIEELLGEEPAGESGAPVAVAVATAEPANVPAEGSNGTAEAAGNGESGESGGNGEGGNAGEPETHDSQEAVEAIVSRLDRIIELQEQLVALWMPGAEDADACGEKTPEDGAEADSDEGAGEGSGEGSGEEPDEEVDPELIGAIAEAIEEAVQSGNPEKQDAVEELGEAIETILEPGVSTTVEETEQEEQDATDAIGRAVIRKLQHSLARMPKKQRKKATAAIDSIFRDTGKGSGVYAGLVAAARKGYGDPRDLGKAIMKKRNPNYEGD